MTEFMPVDDPFVTCLHDAPGVAVWRHDGEPGGSRHVLDLAGDEWLARALSDALAVIPAGGRVSVLPPL